MILIFGGTTEGRLAAQVCEAAGKSYFYSCKNGDQCVTGSHLIPLSGAMDCAQIQQFCQQKGIELLIDAAHPFARDLHRNIAQSGLKVIRLERPSLPLEAPHIHLISSWEELPKGPRTLALTGVKSAPYFVGHDSVLLRIMKRADSLAQIERCHFPHERLLFYPEGGESAPELAALIRQHHIELVICKESGHHGGLDSKIEATRLCQIPLYVMQRPALPSFTQRVYGSHGLRRAIQQLAPDFFPLKTGLTTGSCATAATCAALHALLTQSKPEGVHISLPCGEEIGLALHRCEWDDTCALATVLKDSGDDPCVVHGLEIGARLHLTPQGICLDAAEGVGRATLPGLDMPVGEAAINRVPREMIVQNAQRVMQQCGYQGGVHIELFIPQGEEAARKTLNARLGILGGLSILGTSGIVQPFSNEAFLASIERQLDIILSMGYREVSLNSGAKSEKYLREELAHLPDICFIHYGNLIGDALALCQQKGVAHVHLGLMVGKAVKLAQGRLDTHSRQSAMDKAFLQKIACESTCSPATIERVGRIHAARELWDVVPASEKAFFLHLTQLCHRQASRSYPATQLSVRLLAEAASQIVTFPPHPALTQ